jgi:predicted patatin/cPLA2 family phospholipase
MPRLQQKYATAMGQPFYRAAFLALALAVGGCASVERIPLGASDEHAAAAADMSGLRFFADAPASQFTADIHRIVEGTAARQEGEITYLALSGGGADGAYGAGILNGWTESGKRPEFTIVSGVSTGALMAPFAYLGPRYDPVLKEIYTNGVAETLLGTPNPVNAVFGPGVYSNKHLHEMVAGYIDEATLASIAREHARGRRLFVVTTNLDSQHAVVWNMGAIAASGSSQALTLFRDVLTASASVPVVMTPTLIDVTSDGRQFQEMHVDGSVSAPVFTLPEAFLLGNAKLAKTSRTSIYIIMNDKIDRGVEEVRNSTLDIATRTSATFFKTQARSIILGTYQFTRRNGIGFNLTYLDKEVPDGTGLGLDNAIMRNLYDHGYERGRSGTFWKKAPPAEDLTETQR